MSTQENRAVIERFITEVKNGASIPAIDELCAPDIVHHFPVPNVTPGVAGIKEMGMMIRGAFPDVHVDVEYLLADGDKVVERSIAHATHNGPLMGMPATGKQVGWTETHVYKVVDGKIVEQWSELNLLGVLAQLGALPGMD